MSIRDLRDHSEVDSEQAPAPKGERHSGIVPSARDSAPHLSWAEQGHLRHADETRRAWEHAYESGFDHAFQTFHRGDWLIPFVYASGGNDARLLRALLRFAYDVAVRLPDADAALAVLEVAQSTIDGDINKDLCLRLADNLIDEAYERFTLDRRFDNYFFCHSAAAVARLSAHLEDPDSARDAIEAIQSAVAALRMHDPNAEEEVPKLAARFIRDELGSSAGTTSAVAAEPGKA